MSHTRTIKVDYLARVEGEGALHLVIDQGQVSQAKLNIFEPPRFFEAFLRGRRYEEASDITARICGICPVAYQMSAVHALESLCQAQVPAAVKSLRRLLYCGEWIESHVLHITMLHAPDFLGYDDAISMAKDHKAAVERGLKLKKIGNNIIRVVGGREIHPINVKIGGFYKAPSATAMAELAEQLSWGRQAALELIEWVAGFKFIDFEADYEFVSLVHPQDYPLNEGMIQCRNGLKLGADDYEQHFSEQHVAHSNALQSLLDNDKVYFVGPLARYFHNFEKLPKICQDAAIAANLGKQCFNPFKSIIVRAIEVLFAFDQALKIANSYQTPDISAIPVPPIAGTGRAATEAPRGLLWHRYDLDAQGIITNANIVPPTSQNQRIIERDIAEVAQQHTQSSDLELQHCLEQAIRNYDPCISCATHFLDLTVERIA